ncbi:uncharacterized protein LOC119332544 isoform X1 [Triticum dicoccoides]|uniref:uncharacterized protein LOC119332544 isoform X1 n=1 Tax=Triticum dicoccoides TaxID=85692 RepID=UPI001890C9E3|nr:uncharacterized protein LOC119332544 isoform X1 [Triticum dicoccoides]
MKLGLDLVAVCPSNSLIFVSRNACAARPIESQASISVAEADIRRAGDLRSGGGDAGFLGEDPLLQVCSEATSGWTRRVRIRKAPAERELNPNRKSALELSMRAFILKRDGNVVNPAVGTSFDSLDEAYQFYNLYSWELGFGIRYSKSRLNVERVKCMHEIVCGCAVRLFFFLCITFWGKKSARICYRLTNHVMCIGRVNRRGRIQDQHGAVVLPGSGCFGRTTMDGIFHSTGRHTTTLCQALVVRKCIGRRTGSLTGILRILLGSLERTMSVLERFLA